MAEGVAKTRISCGNPPSLFRGRTPLGTRIASVILILITACGGIGSKAGPLSHVVPIPDLTIDDTVEELDFLVQDGHIAHLVYEMVRRGNSDIVRQKELWYQRGDLRDGTWSRPYMLKSGGVSGPRIIAVNRRIYVTYLSAHSIGSISSVNDGKDWSSDGPPFTEQSVISYDVINEGSHLVFLCMADALDNDGFITGRQKVIALPINQGRGACVTVAVGAHATRTGPRPRLLGNNQTLTGAFCFSEISGGVAFARGDEHVLVSRSSDGGATWGTSSELAVTPGLAGVETFDIAQTADGLFIMLVDDAKLRLIRLDAAGRVTEFTDRLGKRSDGQFTSLASTTTAGGKGYAFWVDSRNAKTDAISPLSDQPYWLNNDIFCSNLDDPTQLRRPIQVTATGGYVRAISAKAVLQGVAVIWAGRGKVGRSEKAYGQRYEIRYAIVDR